MLIVFYQHICFLVRPTTVCRAGAAALGPAALVAGLSYELICLPGGQLFWVEALAARLATAKANHPIQMPIR